MSNYDESKLPDTKKDIEPHIALDFLIQDARAANASENDLAKWKKLALRSLLAVFLYSSDVSDEDLEQVVITRIRNAASLESNETSLICLLRLASEPSMSWLFDDLWARAIVKLLDDTGLNTLIQLPVNVPAFQKLEHSTRYVKEQESRLEQALGTLTSLERYRAQRHELLKVLHSKPGQLFIQPFLPVSILGYIGEIYQRIEKYMECRDTVEIVEIFPNITGNLNALNRELDESPTISSRLLQELGVKRLLYFLEQDFKSNKAVQPAQLSVEGTDKKYPIHTVGEIVTPSFMVVNKGSGYAYDVTISAIADESIELEGQARVGQLSPGASQIVEFPAVVRKNVISVQMILEVNWANFDGTRAITEKEFELVAQPGNVPWDQLERTNPYSLEPVTDASELVGRRELLNRLIGVTDSEIVGSSIIFGQKRVGKTSIAKSLQSYLAEKGYCAIYLEGGDYVEPRAETTITRLGRRLSRKIRDFDKRLIGVDLPNFTEALSPLTDFLDEVTDLMPELRIVFILDEFDQLPVELYMPGPLGNAFFLTLRSISSRRNIGFVIVGGEKMTYVMHAQGSQLNKWISAPIDYFSRDTDWTDFVELVRRPVEGILEIADQSIEKLYAITAGNPYFTKLICQYVFSSSVERRDAHITPKEIDVAIAKAVHAADVNTFQHFWDDGIFETEMRAIEKARKRQRVLVAVSDGLARQRPCPADIVINHQLMKTVVAPDIELKDFVNRRILLVDRGGLNYDFKVQLFEQWLIHRGVQDILVSFVDADAALRERLQEEQFKVQSAEVVALLQKWGSKYYKSQEITEDRIRTWLEQFGDARAQRAMFTLLQGLRFISDGYVREQLKEIDAVIKRTLPQYIREGVRSKRKDILVSYLDGPGKSGARFAALYADEANIAADNVVEKGKLVKALKTKEGVQAIVFLDDFVGTGSQATRELEFIDSIVSPLLHQRKLKVFFLSIVSFVDGWKHIQEFLGTLKIDIETHYCDLLHQDAKCFGPESSVFPDTDQREYAKGVALKHGARLQKNMPLGYGELELAVVFETSCPNNSLPILWSEAPDSRWFPLFLR